MKFPDALDGIAIDSDFAVKTEESRELLQAQLAALQDRLRELPADHDPEMRAGLLLDAARNLVLLEEGAEAWKPAREAFDIFSARENWEQAVESCSLMYKAEQDQSLAALGQGVWLAVTFPIDPELSVAMLEHVVDDVPDDSDGGAVAATVAHYIADIRAEGQVRENLLFFTGQLLAKVARRHSDINSQSKFDWWMDKLELTDPAKFLPRLRNVVDVLVQDDWWLDREAIYAKLPVN